MADSSQTIPRFIPQEFGQARYPNSEQNPDFSFTTVDGVASHPDWDGSGEPEYINVSYEINTKGGRGKPGLGALSIGNLYEITISIPDNDRWAKQIQEVILISDDPGSLSAPSSPQKERRAPESPAKVVTATVHHVDDQRAYSEWQSTVLRTGQIAATERVRTYVDLIIAGKLYSKNDTLVDKVTSEQLDQLYERLFANYMNMVTSYPTNPSFADFKKQGGSDD